MNSLNKKQQVYLKTRLYIVFIQTKKINKQSKTVVKIN